MPSYLERIELALNDLRQGKMVILADDPDRENEGDLIFPAEIITPEVVNFMIRNGSGIVCLSLIEEQIKKMGLSLMVAPHENSSLRGTPFTLPIDAKHGVTTGVSAADRANTIKTAVEESVSPNDLIKPGHVYPLQAKAGGVLERAGHTEGAIDLMRLAGFKPSAVICEVMNKDGTMASGSALHDFAKEHELTILSIDDLITYRRIHENLIEEEISSVLPLENLGKFKLTVIKEKFSNMEHVILSKEVNQESENKHQGLLVRIHSACMTGDLFGSQRCDCKQQLDYSMKKISEEGGLLIYLNQEGRGIGLFNKIKAYVLQETGLDTIEANQKLGFPVDLRNYYIAANILKNKNICHIRLLTNNPNKIADLKKYGVHQIDIEPIPTFCNENNKNYLQVKKDKLNHNMDFNL